MTASLVAITSRRYSVLFGILAVLLGIGSGALVVFVNKPLYMLAAIGGLIVVAATIGSVEFGLLFLTFITYTRFSDIVVQYYNAPSVAKSFIVLLILAIFIRWALFGERPNRITVPGILLIAYGLVGLGSLLYAVDSSAVMAALDDYVKNAAIALVAIAVLRNPAQFRHVIWTLLIVGIFLGALSVLQYLTKNYSGVYGGFAVAKLMNITTGVNDYRLTGPVGDPNFFAQVMLVLGLLGVERLFHERTPLLRSLAGVSAGLSILTVVFTFSRGAFIALSLALVMYFLLYPPKPVQVVALLILGIALFAFIPSTYYDRVLTIQDIFPTQNGFINVKQDAAIQGRASENLTALVMFAKNPLFGVGLSNFPILYQDYTKSLGLAPSSQQRAPHDLYLEVAAETGIVGLIAFMAIVVLAYRSILLARKKAINERDSEYTDMITGFGIAFTGYMLAAFFVHGAYPRYFYLLIGIAFALPMAFNQLQNRGKKNAPPARLSNVD
jgi:O-antigen ligase